MRSIAAFIVTIAFLTGCQNQNRIVRLYYIEGEETNELNQYYTYSFIYNSDSLFYTSFDRVSSENRFQSALFLKRSDSRMVYYLDKANSDLNNDIDSIEFLPSETVAFYLNEGSSLLGRSGSEKWKESIASYAGKFGKILE